MQGPRGGKKEERVRESCTFLFPNNPISVFGHGSWPWKQYLEQVACSYNLQIIFTFPESVLYFLIGTNNGIFLLEVGTVTLWGPAAKYQPESTSL